MLAQNVYVLGAASVFTFWLRMFKFSRSPACLHVGSECLHSSMFTCWLRMCTFSWPPACLHVGSDCLHSSMFTCWLRMCTFSRPPACLHGAGSRPPEWAASVIVAVTSTINQSSSCPSYNCDCGAFTPGVLYIALKQARTCLLQEKVRSMANELMHSLSCVSQTGAHITCPPPPSQHRRHRHLSGGARHISFKSSISRHRACLINTQARRSIRSDPSPRADPRPCLSRWQSPRDRSRAHHLVSPRSIHRSSSSQYHQRAWLP